MDRANRFSTLAKRSGAAAACIAVLSLAAPALAQVAITTGVQEIYDDNIFLENGRNRPAPFVANDAITQDISDGTLSILYNEQNDGKLNDDLITNVFLEMSSHLAQWEKYGDVLVEGKVGGLLFADQTDESRLTLDAALDITASENIIPQPFYLQVRNEVNSESESIGVAQGTAAAATESYTGAARLGFRTDVAPRTTWDLGYTGAYHAFLGEIRFQDAPTAPSFNDEGADYHTHTASTTLDHQLTQNLVVGLAGDAGVQLFTNVPNNTATVDGQTVESTATEGQMDRTNINGAITMSYLITETLSLKGSAGYGLEELHDEPTPQQYTIIGDNGQPTTFTTEPEKTNDSFIYSGYLDYAVVPGSVLQLGAIQTMSTEVTGEPIVSRSFFGNATLGLTDRFVLTLASSFTQFSSGGTLTETTDRLELGASVSYSLTQNTALVLGYNYADQNADEADLAQALAFTQADYTSNRAFVGINMGFVGLPM